MIITAQSTLLLSQFAWSQSGKHTLCPNLLVYCPSYIPAAMTRSRVPTGPPEHMEPYIPEPYLSFQREGAEPRDPSWSRRPPYVLGRNSALLSGASTWPVSSMIWQGHGKPPVDTSQPGRTVIPRSHSL